MIPKAWTAIAWRPRDESLWRIISDAPLELSEAKRMAERGMLLMANRHFEDRVELVVRATRERGAGLT